MKPYFSLIIPVYNLESFIKQCLDSVLNQSFLSWEAIIVNDGSFDNSLIIINEYINHDKRFKLINKENEGLSVARNDAIKLVKGDYLLFLDGDDWLDKNALQLIYNILIIKPIDVLVHKMYYYYSDNDYNVRSTKLVEKAYTGIDFLHTVLNVKEYNYFVAPSKVYKTKFLKRNSLQFINGIIHEDGPFFFDICRNANRIYFFNSALYFYRQNREGQITSNLTYRNYLSYFKGVEHIYKTYGKNDRIINGAIINNLTFFIKGFNTIEDERKVFNNLRNWKQKKLLIYLLFNSKIDFRVKFKGFFLFVDPLFIKLIYSIYFKI